jgi:hypothetical protein
MPRISIMQPYFLPYIGYFQLINAADVFVVYDNIKYTKKGWINRNRFLSNGEDAVFTVPLKQDSDFLNIVERKISDTFDKVGLVNRIKGAYSKAPYFPAALKLFEDILFFEDKNLFSYNLNSIQKTCDFLGIKTKILISSSLDIDHSLKAEEKVLAICKNLKADEYVNAIGGKELYSKERFAGEAVKLKFIKTRPIEYQQLGGVFAPGLSILDVMMFNSEGEIKKMLGEFDLI